MSGSDDQERDMIESLLAAGFDDADAEAADDKHSQDVIDKLFAAPDDSESVPPAADSQDAGEEKGGPIPDAEPPGEEKKAIVDPKAKKKPKIDLTALKKAKEKKQGGQVSVSRLFGDAEPGSHDSAPKTADPGEDEFFDPGAGLKEPTPAAKAAEPTVAKVRRGPLEVVEDVTETLQATNPALLNALGLVGMFLAFNAAIIVLLALAGWI